MNDNNKSDDQEDLLSQPLNPNEYLASMRKQKGIGERAAADALKISVARLKSIETGDFKVFPSQTYVRGHLRNYSRFLDVDENVIVKAYDSANPPLFDFVNPEKNNKKEKKGSGGASSKSPWVFLLLLIILVGLWAAAYNFFGQSPIGFKSIFSSSASQSLPTEESNSLLTRVEIEEAAKPDESASEAASKVLDNDEQALSTIGSGIDKLIDSNGAVSNEGGSFSANNSEVQAVTSDDGSSVLSLSGVSTAPNIVVSKVTAAELVKSVANTEISVLVEELEPDAHVLTFNFTNPCWLKVTDAKGDVLFVGLKASGTQLRLIGNAPFNVVLGNVDGTSLAYNNEPVTLGPQVNSRPLRLTVGG